MKKYSAATAAVTTRIRTTNNVCKPSLSLFVFFVDVFSQNASSHQCPEQHMYFVFFYSHENLRACLYNFYVFFLSFSSLSFRRVVFYPFSISIILCFTIRCYAFVFFYQKYDDRLSTRIKKESDRRRVVFFLLNEPFCCLFSKFQFPFKKKMPFS